MEPALSSTETADLELMPVLGKFERLIGYLGRYLIGLQDQRLHVLCLDRKARLLHHWRLAVPDGFEEAFRQVMAASLATPGTVSVILAHRHPGRSPVATVAEKNLRVQLKRALRNSGIRLGDYIIFGPTSLWSYEERRTLSYGGEYLAVTRAKARPRLS